MKLRSRTRAPQADPYLPLFRDLYTRVLARGHGRARDQGCPIVAVTSAIEREGKSTVALRLASTLAEDRARARLPIAQNRVLIVDCDPYHASAAGAFELPPSPGLVQFLLDEVPIDAVLRSTPAEYLSILPPGGSPADFSAAIRAPGARRGIQALRTQAGVIILDLPSLRATSDAQVLAGVADSVVFVVRAGATPAPLVSRALEQIDRTKLEGVVLNDVRPALPEWLQHRL